MNQSKTIDFDEGWNVVQKGLTKLKALLEGEPDAKFTSDEYMMIYEANYNMMTQNNDYSQRLYEKYRETFEEYLSSTVLPSVQEKHDEFLLRDFAKRWSNNKVMIYWMFRFFHYLERHYIPKKSIPGLKEVALTCFRDLVYANIKGKVREAVLFLINQEREGEEIDQALLKNVLDIFLEIGKGQMDCYVNDFELQMLEDTTAYYSQKASKWISEDSLPEYKLKAEQCLKLEKDRVSHYLHSSSEPNYQSCLRVQHELLAVHAAQLLEKEESG